MNNLVNVYSDSGLLDNPYKILEDFSKTFITEKDNKK